MKLALASLMLLSSIALPAQARGPVYDPTRIRYRDTGDYSNYKAYESKGGYAREEKCFKRVYREEYIPGDMRNPGYVRSYKKRVSVPCDWKYYNRRPAAPPIHEHKHEHKEKDDNSCIEGAVLGGISGAGAGAVLSRGDGRWWAIPLGIVGGSMVGCQIDGG